MYCCINGLISWPTFQMLNQKYDDLELPNITPLPAAKPINLEGGLTHSAFGDIAMVVEFIYAYNKFLAPEETPSITAGIVLILCTARQEQTRSI